MTRRAALYTRVSSEEQAAGGTSLETQAQRCRSWCEAQDWAVVDLYEDAGVSGALGSRPALDRMLNDAHAGQVDVIVVAKLDRLARSMRHLSPLLGELDDAGVALVSVAETFDSSSTHGRLVRNMLGSLAEWERDVIRDRTRTGLRARVRQGGWGGGNIAPYGYRIVGEGSSAHLEVDETEAEMVRLAVGLFLDQGLTSGEVARRLNALGHTPRNAPLWTSQNLRNMLNRGQFDGVWTFGKPSKRTRGEPITIQVPPLVPPERMAALRAQLAATSRQRGPGSAHPLSGRLFCPCGAYMTGIARGDRANRRYRCRYGRHEPGRPSAGCRACSRTRWTTRCGCRCWTCSPTRRRWQQRPVNTSGCWATRRRWRRTRWPTRRRRWSGNVGRWPTQPHGACRSSWTTRPRGGRSRRCRPCTTRRCSTGRCCTRCSCGRRSGRSRSRKCRT